VAVYDIDFMTLDYAADCENGMSIQAAMAWNSFRF
jgi:hypothetical protein